MPDFLFPLFFKNKPNRTQTFSHLHGATTPSDLSWKSADPTARLRHSWLTRTNREQPPQTIHRCSLLHQKHQFTQDKNDKTFACLDRQRSGAPTSFFRTNSTNGQSCTAFCPPAWNTQFCPQNEEHHDSSKIPNRLFWSISKTFKEKQQIQIFTIYPFLVRAPSHTNFSWLSVFSTHIQGRHLGKFDLQDKRRNKPNTQNKSTSHPGSGAPSEPGRTSARCVADTSPVSAE